MRIQSPRDQLPNKDRFWFLRQGALTGAVAAPGTVAAPTALVGGTPAQGLLGGGGQGDSPYHTVHSGSYGTLGQATKKGGSWTS